MTYPKSWSPHFRAKVERDIEAAQAEETRYQQERQEARNRAIWLHDLVSRPLKPPVIPKWMVDIIDDAENKMTATAAVLRERSGGDQWDEDHIREMMQKESAPLEVLRLTQLDGHGRGLYRRINAVIDFIGPLREG